MKIKGSGTYTDASGRSHSVFGAGEVSDGENLKSLKVSGDLSFEKISCDKISISGKCEGGTVSAQSLKISGACEADSVSAKNLSVSGKIEVDSLTIEQTLEISGKPQIDSVKADEIVIATRNGFIGEVECRRIKIFDESEQFNGVKFVQRFSRVQIKNIDAQTVQVENCAVDVIRCKDAFIGSNCAIEKLFVAGKCEVAADSTVGETIRT